MKANPGSGRSNWQVNLYGILGSKMAVPPKIGGPVRPNTSNMPRAGPELARRAVNCAGRADDNGGQPGKIH